ncbi:hypothetical protein [Shinella sp. NM-101]|uniref:hypothetical protein n=1 Tax=Shinella sp. NM-101 TaxID=2744455 RepID=UPI001F238CC0|nr:hypothetical protein [Shinella sp. NM-101]
MQSTAQQFLTAISTTSPNSDSAEAAEHIGAVDAGMISAKLAKGLCCLPLVTETNS